MHKKRHILTWQKKTRNVTFFNLFVIFMWLCDISYFVTFYTKTDIFMRKNDISYTKMTYLKSDIKNLQMYSFWTFLLFSCYFMTFYILLLFIQNVTYLWELMTYYAQKVTCFKVTEKNSKCNVFELFCYFFVILWHFIFCSTKWHNVRK